MWSQYRFWPHALLSEPCVKLDRLKQSSFEPAMRLSGSVSRLLVDLGYTHDASGPVRISRGLRDHVDQSRENSR